MTSSKADRKAAAAPAVGPLWAVLMAGGSGTRFWPASRAARPKQLIRLAADRTLIQTTFDRIQPLVPPERVLVVTAHAHARAVAKQLPEVPAGNILVEPVGRNTAACAALAVREVLARDPGGILSLFPADHVIADQRGWCRLIEDGCRLVGSRDTVVTFGLKPTRPEVGFGYIRAGEPVTGSGIPNLRTVAGFVEKPVLAKAQEFLDSGQYLWNSGVFVVRARRLAALIEEHQPEIWAGLAVLARARGRAAKARALAQAYPKLPSVSLDAGVMEKVRDMVLLPAEVGWSDVGSWSALDEVLPRDDHQNVSLGPVLTLDSTNCVLYSSGATIAALGLRDLVVVQTPDAILVCPKDRAQEVRQIVDRLKAAKKDELI